MGGGVSIQVAQPPPFSVGAERLAVSEQQSRFLCSAINGSIRGRLIATLIAATLIGCAGLRGIGMRRSGGVSDRPFGGAPAIDLPPSALAMGAYLKAEVATDNGDHEEAFRDYEEAVKFDPHNAALRVKLADLYVREGRLKDALAQAQEAIALDPGFVRGHLLDAGISSALGDDAAAAE